MPRNRSFHNRRIDKTEDPRKVIQQYKCMSKYVYDSKRQAEIHAERFMKELGTWSRPYRCWHCKRWHLTSKPEKQT